MTIFFGASPTTEERNWNHTIVDRSVTLPAGATVTALGIYSTAAKTYDLKIGCEISASSYEVLLSQSFAHPGGGWADTTLAAPFTVPQTGIHRFMAWCSNTAPTNASIVVARASKQGVNVPPGITSGFYVDSQSAVAMRAMIDDSAPPPPATPRYIFIMCGQSNGMNMANQAGAAFIARFKELVPDCDATLINAAVGGSTISTWMPGQPRFNNAVSVFNSALQPLDAVAGALLWFHGENPSCYVDQAIRYDESMAAIFAAFRAETQHSVLPVAVAELFICPDWAERPYWDKVQDNQRLICDPDWRHFFDGAVPVSLADLPGSAADPLHLGTAELQTAARRCAEALTPLFVA
jgi:hypothetical protein